MNEPGRVTVEPSIVVIDPGRVIVEPGNVVTDAGRVIVEPGKVKVWPGIVDPGKVKTEPGRVTIDVVPGCIIVVKDPNIDVVIVGPGIV